MSDNAKKLIVLHVIRKIIDIFLGPFLTAYIFKISTDSITMVSLYNIFAYIVIAVFAFLVGRFIKNKYEMQVFRIGMIAKFVQLIILTILGEKIINYIWLVAIISGISTITWYFPLNLFSSTLVAHKEKKEYIVYKTMISNIISVVLPVLFGTFISKDSFERTTIIVLILSFIQIIFSFSLKYEKKPETYKFKLVETFKKLIKNKNVVELFKAELILGMTYEGALNTCVTLLIIMAFGHDFSLGVVTSIISVLSIFSAYICKRFINLNNLFKAIVISSVVPLLSTIVLLFVTNNYTIIAYNIIYTFFIQIVSITNDVKTMKLTNSKVINDSNRVEAFVLFEMFLGMGRIISYILLLLVGLSKQQFLLNVLIIFLTICILCGGIHLTRVEVEQ